MPKRRPVPTLMKLGTACLTQMIMAIKTEEHLHAFQKLLAFVTEHTGTARMRFPFSIMDDVMAEVKEQKMLNAHNLKLFLTPDRIKLDLSWLDFLNKELLNMISQNCKDLQVLNLGYSTELVGLIESLPHLTKIHLGEAHVVVLETIFQNCKQLEELSLYAHYCITDAVLEQLSNQYCCANLKVLTIYGGLITPEGKATILENFPKIQAMSSDNFKQVLLLLWERSERTNQVYSLMLEELYAYNCHDKFGKKELKRVSKMCPNLASLMITILRSDLRHLRVMSNLKKLKKLNLSIKCKRPIQKIRYLDLRALESFGGRLQVLKLFHAVAEIDVAEIAQYCPNLVELCLAITKLKLGRSKGFSNNPFKHVTSLVLMSYCHSVYLDQFEYSEKEAIRFLLRSCANVKELHLDDIDFLTDEEILRIVKDKYNLESLRLEALPLITPSMIYIMLLKDSKLRQLHIGDCKQILKEHYEQFLDFIRKNNLDIEMKLINVSERFTD